MKADRPINFSDDFNDPEFQSWEIADFKGIPTLFLRFGESILRLQYANRVFEGRDARGGFSIMRPPTNAIKSLEDWRTAPRNVPLFQEKQMLTIAKTSDTAILGDYVHEGYDNYPVHGVELKDALNDLFKAGYSRVMVLNTKLANISAIPLLSNLEPFLGLKTDGGEVGSVQLMSSNTPGQADEIQKESGDWRGFMLKHDIWFKIQKNVLDSKGNFEYNMTQAFTRHNLVRLSTSLSRVTDWTPQDSRRKNFKVNNEKA